MKMAASIKQGKALLRKEMKTKLSSIPDHIKNAQSQIVTRKVLALTEYQNSKRVSVYLSMKNEVQTETLVRHILESNKACFVPRYNGEAMSMVGLNSWQDYLDLPETKWKIKQPALNELRVDALETGGLDVILTPGVAFTAAGHRCGHGKGYYDDFLRRCADKGGQPVSIALAFLEQICADVPVTDNDVTLDHVVYASQEEIDAQLTGSS